MKTVKTRKFWINTVCFSIILCMGGLVELMIRRQTPASMYLLNKSLASTAILLIAVSYVISALITFRILPKKYLAYRRYTGIVGFGYALSHIVTTFKTPDPQSTVAYKFPFPEYFLERPLAMGSALVGLAIFIYAFALSLPYYSNNGTPEKARAWRIKLRYGYIGVLCIALHMSLLKFEGWVSWIRTLTPKLPPLSLIVGSILTGMVLIKILHFKKERRIFVTRLPEKVREND